MNNATQSLIDELTLMSKNNSEPHESENRSVYLVIKNHELEKLGNSFIIWVGTN